MLADGKIYVGTDGGKFFIIRPHADRGEILSRVELPNSTASCCGSEGTPEQIARRRRRLARPRLLRLERRGLRHRPAPGDRRSPGCAVDEPAATGQGAPAHLQVSPTELVLTPGQTVKLRVRLFDDKGRFLREDAGATWTLEGLKGTAANNAFTVASDPVEQAGTDHRDRRHA